MAPTVRSFLMTNGYIRDNDLGQTYAVVTRESDGAVVRVWISSMSPHVGDIDWAATSWHFYNHPVDVVNAIPLDQHDSGGEPTG